jgi:recombination protein RecA
MTKRTLKRISETVAKVKEEKQEIPPITKPNWNFVVSTGSTILDLIISGGRVRYGGIPCGIMVEFFGAPGGGKTALLASIAASVQRMGGKARIKDPEGRLDEDYSKIYGLDISKAGEYERPKTIMDVFEKSVYKWDTFKDNPKAPSMIGCDGAAALSTEMEMESKDKMGQRRAKEFREGCRKSCLKISESNRLFVWTNQIIDNVGAMGYAPKTIAPGGYAIPFFSSLRCRVTQIKKLEVEKSLGSIRKSLGLKVKDEEKEEGKKGEKAAAKLSSIRGIKTRVKIEKSSVDEPFRECDITIRFNYGIDDIADNLEYLKFILGTENYNVLDKKTSGWASLSSACYNIEQENLEKELKDKVVEVWNAVKKAFTEERKPRVFV